MQKIDFVVPATGSNLFDVHTYTVMKKLCDKFPTLDFSYSHTKGFHIFGDLADEEYQKWNELLFNVEPF